MVAGHAARLARGDLFAVSNMTIGPSHLLIVLDREGHQKLSVPSMACPSAWRGTPLTRRSGCPSPTTLENAVACCWFPDGRRILVWGEETGKPTRLYLWDLAGGGSLHPLTPIHTGFPMGPVTKPISPDGSQVAPLDAEGRLWLYPVGTGTPRLVPGFTSDDVFLRWTADGRALFIWRRSALPLRSSGSTSPRARGSSCAKSPLPPPAASSLRPTSC